MIKIRTNKIYQFGITIIVIITFALPGLIQFFFGVPNTLYSLGVLSIIYIFIFLHIIISKKVFYNKILLVSLIYLFLILWSGIINNSSLAKIAIYSAFALTPFGINYFFEIIRIKYIRIRVILSNTLRLIILIQLPILLLQKYGYDLLIMFSNSPQSISRIDFMFGSFSIKADHALGFFLITYLLNIIFKLRSKELNNTPWFIIIYISICILIMESNMTKIILLLVFSYYISIWIYKKIKIFGILICAVLFYFMFNTITKNSTVISNEIYHYKYLLTDIQSLKAVENGYAKRPQVLIYQLNYEPFKWVGNGPYDYYNILTSKFKNTVHFSQIIWTYNDLGIFGIIVILILTFLLVRSLNLRRESNFLMLIIIMLYLLMTNVYYDIAMILSLSLLNRKIK